MEQTTTGNSHSSKRFSREIVVSENVTLRQNNVSADVPVEVERLRPPTFDQSDESDDENIRILAEEEKQLRAANRDIIYYESDDDENINLRILAEQLRAAQPTFDQSIKPAAQQTHAIIEGLNGLKNLGYTCYINNIIQCLINTEGLRRYLLNDFSPMHINR